MPDGAGLRGVHIIGRTDGLLLTLDIEQRYANFGPAPIEIVHAFPIPSDAVIHGLELVLDGEPIAVALHDRQDAETLYETVQTSTGFTAMVERLAPGLCMASLGRLAPGAAAVLCLRIGQFLAVVGGSARIAIPTVANYPEGSRYAAFAGPLGLPRPSFHAEYPLTLDLTLLGAAKAARITSPTHRLARSATIDTLRLAEPAALDRDVVIVLAGLSNAGGAICADPRGGIAVATFTPSVAGDRRPLNVDILIDAAGPLGIAGGDVEDFILTLAAEFEAGDRVAIVRAGRTIQQVLPLTEIGTAGIAPGALSFDAIGLGDLARGRAVPPECVRAESDILLISDGCTRLAEAVCDLARDTGRRLFVLAVGSAPSEAVMAPAAAATGGDYVALAPAEPIEPALHRLLGALTIPPIAAPIQKWAEASDWAIGPAMWRAGRRGITIAGLGAALPRSSVAMFGGGTETLLCRLDETWRGEAAATVMALAAARRLPQLPKADREEWARRFGLLTGATALIGSSERAGPAGDADLLVVPRMVAAGWRGVGTLSPIPPPEPPPARRAEEAPYRPPAGRSGAPRFVLGAIAAILIAIAGAGAWLANRPATPSPMLADRFDRAPGGSVSPGEAGPSPIAVGGSATHRSGASPRLLVAGAIAALLAFFLLARRRRRRG